MNAAQAQAWLQENKKPVLIAAAAGVGLLGLRKARTAGGEPKASGGSGLLGGGGTTSAGTAFATGPAIAGTATPYDSSMSDLANAVAGIQQTLTAPVPMPSGPLASTLTGAAGTGKYFRNKYGSLIEVESDGSLYGLNGSEAMALTKAGRLNGAAITDVADWSALPGFYTQIGNLNALNNGGDVKPQTFTVGADPSKLVAK